MKGIFFLYVLMFAGKIFAQPPRIIDIDSIGKDQTLKVKFKTPVYFKFNNVNPLFSDSITLTATSFNFSSNVPDIFSNPDAGSPLTAGTGAVPKTSGSSFSAILKQMDLNADIMQSSQVKGRDMTALLKENERLIDSLRAALKNITLQDSLKKEFVKQYTIFKKSLENLSISAQLEEYIIQQLKKEGVIIRNPAVLTSNLNAYFRSINNGSTNDDDFRKDIFKGLDAVNESYAQLSQLYDALGKTLAAEKLSLTGKLVDDEKEVSFNIKDAPVSLDRKKFFFTEFAFAKQRMELINKDSVRNALINSINRGADLYKKIINNKFEKLDGPYFVTSDQATFTPKIKNDKGQVVKEFEIPVQARRGVKVDFSTGYLLSFGGDEDYHTVYDTTGKAAGVVLSNKEHLTHSLGALVNVYSRSANGIAVGGSFGISIPIEGSLNFYLGASLLALERNRLVITAGVSWVKLKLLNTANLEVKNSKYVFSSDVREAQYDQRYRATAFIGITYNIFSLSPGDKKN